MNEGSELQTDGAEHPSVHLKTNHGMIYGLRDTSARR